MRRHNADACDASLRPSHSTASLKTAITRIAAVGLAVGLTMALPVDSAYAGETVADHTVDAADSSRTSSDGTIHLADQETPAANAMPENPGAELPAQVSADIPDDATVVSEELAVTAEGEVKDIETGTTVTDPAIVGTADTPADPLAKTDGKSFIPVDASAVKDAVAANGGDANATSGDSGAAADSNAGAESNDDATATPDAAAGQDTGNNNDSAGTNGTDSSNADANDSADNSTPDTTDNAEDSASSDGSDAGTTPDATANPSAFRSSSSAQAQPHVYAANFTGNQYGAHWGTYNGTSAFFDVDNALFAQQAKGVIDVSKWQGTIDWAKAKADGVQGAIIRLGFGSGNAIDGQAKRNISECKRLGIPFGVYWFSYAESANAGNWEGEDTVAKLRAAGVRPSDLSFPVFYDLEDWTGSWNGHTAPTNPNTWNGAVNNWYAKLKAAGYNNLSVYSYTSYLKSALKNNNIWSKTRWVASYGARTGFEVSANDRFWQYTSDGHINGISGTVDLNAFGYKTVANSNNSNNSNSNSGNSNSQPTYPVKGAMGEEWARIGGSKSVIGNPIANEVCNWSAGKQNCYQNFERGAISWTPSTGAHYTSGELRKEWANRHYEHGVLGYPTADEERLSDGWWRQHFQHGDIWVKGTTTKYVMLLNLRDSYNAHGGYARLGAPTGNEERLSNGYWRQRCARGDVWTRNGAAEKYVMLLNLRDSYNAHGGFGRLGGPTHDEERLSDGYWRQRCVRGDVWTRNGAAEKYVMLLNLRDSYNAHGGFGRLGGPTHDEERLSDGYWRQRCVRGDVWTRNGAAKKYVMLLALRDEYYRLGGFSKNGGPTSDEWHSGLWYQRCQRHLLQVP
ncbi:GH25 family lysozyme [Bifidobacterium olomucense]|uniref:1 4-beta-N-acetylmuramidase n=1 Tax=Bifidobacterium olomucense TaxID=2675324 RepID=A0A7Y0EZT0_9BIFI|nr:GH25 family lysozyme [Bifidobacterium sp. DSM 109959]NMM98426.1 1 4-beta-N-acetylmuramidase [Bifidobacterium sp. DSM 109959]